MDEGIVRRALEAFAARGFEGDRPFTELRGYKAVPFSADNYRELKSVEAPLVFVDGGNAELLGSSTVSFSYLRAASVEFNKKKKARIIKDEFPAIAKTEIGEGGRARVRVTLFRGKEEEFVFDPMDESLRKGLFRATPSDVIGVARRILELEVARNAVLSSEKSSGLVVLYGTLQCFFRQELRALEGLRSAAMEKGWAVASLAKTSSITTASGASLSASLIANAPCETWAYCPLFAVENEFHPAEISYARLHKKAKAAFRFEVLSDFLSARSMEEYASMLAANSSDPAFFGYPYGLVFADSIARVSNEELEYLKARMFSLAKDRQGIISMVEQENNPHSVLDSMR